MRSSWSDEASQCYPRLVIAGHKVAGAILLGYPREAPGVAAAVKASQEVADCLAALRAGEWEVLQNLR